jgi:hypothetical protein
MNFAAAGIVWVWGGGGRGSPSPSHPTLFAAAVKGVLHMGTVLGGGGGGGGGQNKI